MDGLLRSNLDERERDERKRERVIEHWILTITHDGGIERFDSLHIDRIDGHWKPRQAWTEGGFDAYRLALKIRDRHGLDLSVVLAFALVSDETPRGVDFSTREQLHASLNWMPPALYLFRPGEAFWTAPARSKAEGLTDDISVIEIDPNVFGVATPIKACYYMEFKPADSGEYSRSVFVEG